MGFILAFSLKTFFIFLVCMCVLMHILHGSYVRGQGHLVELVLFFCLDVDSEVKLWSLGLHSKYPMC